MRTTQSRLFLPVRPYTRLAYFVESATRPGIEHLVDLEGYDREEVVCTCESFIMGGMRPCLHIQSVAICV